MKKTSNLLLSALAVALCAGIFFSGCSKKEETSKKSKKSGKKTEESADETDDDVKAVEWWTKGVKESDSTSASNMGWACQYGEGGVKQDFEKALEYYAMAIFFAYYDGNKTTEEYARNAIEGMVTDGSITREQADAALQKVADMTS